LLLTVINTSAAIMLDGVIHYLPAIAAVLLLITFRYSLPFVWTIRVFMPYFKVRVNSLYSRISRIKNGPSKSTSALAKHERVLSAQGCDPFDDIWTWRHHATIDDCDFMGHLSNSSYPKNLDVARMEFAAHRLADFMKDGGWIALGSSSFQFHREIPVLARYSIVSRIETWNDKWLYMKNEFRGKSKRDENVVFCTSITKHCFKFGRKTIPPWFVLAYCGYSGTSEATLKQTNASRSRDLRKTLKSGKERRQTPLQAFERLDSANMLKKVPAWCSPDAWDVASWERQRVERMKALMNDF
jgi:acyl-CoA thioesterase FadM